MDSVAIETFRALGFAASTSLCALMGVLQWRSGRRTGGGRIYVLFWLSGLIWTGVSFVRAALLLGGAAPTSQVAAVLEVIAWSTTGVGAVTSTGVALDLAPAGKTFTQVSFAIAGLASTVVIGLFIAVAAVPGFALGLMQVSAVSFYVSAVFGLAHGLLWVLRRRAGPGATPRNLGGFLIAGLGLLTLEIGSVVVVGFYPQSITANLTALALGEQWPIPWAILAAAFLARSHYVDVVLRRSLAVVLAIVLSASLLAWRLSGLSLVIASLAAAGLMLAAPSLYRALGWMIERLVLRRADYKALAKGFADAARRAADAQALTTLAEATVSEALHLLARLVEGKAGEAPAFEVATAGRTLLQNEHDFIDAVAAETGRRLESLAFEQARREGEFREERLSHAATQAELKALLGQVDAHFLFNTLNAIADLITTDPDKAEAMTERLADVFRYTLSRQDRTVSTLDEELEFIRQYLAIEQVRFGERLQVAFHRDDGIGASTAPSLILQPLVENAVRHGLAPRREGGRISISARRRGDFVELSVDDDGVGMAADGEPGLGIGLHSVRARLQALYGEAARMSVGVGLAGRGVSVSLRLPA